MEKVGRRLTDEPKRAEEPGAKITLSDGRELAGEISDADAAAIVATSATRAELEEAYQYACGYGDAMDRSGHPLNGVVAEIYEILISNEADRPER